MSEMQAEQGLCGHPGYGLTHASRVRQKCSKEIQTSSWTGVSSSGSVMNVAFNDLMERAVVEVSHLCPTVA